MLNGIILLSPFSILMAGILPFGAMFIELFFIFSVSWIKPTPFKSAFIQYNILNVLMYWCFSASLWISAHCGVLYSLIGDLGKPVLLPVWLPVPCLHNSCCFLLSNQHRDGILSTLCRGRYMILEQKGTEPFSTSSSRYWPIVMYSNTLNKTPQV